MGKSVSTSETSMFPRMRHIIQNCTFSSTEYQGHQILSQTLPPPESNMGPMQALELGILHSHSWVNFKNKSPLFHWQKCVYLGITRIAIQDMQTMARLQASPQQTKERNFISWRKKVGRDRSPLEKSKSSE